MKCRLCEKFFNLDSSFIFLFSFPEICPSCKIKFHNELKIEKIPIDQGEITYIYLYDFNLNLVQRNYLDRYHTIFFEFVINRINAFDLIIFLDDYIFNDIMNWWGLFTHFGNILLCSLTFYDFSSRIYFD